DRRGAPQARLGDDVVAGRLQRAGGDRRRSDRDRARRRGAGDPDGGGVKLTIDVADRVDKALGRFYPEAGRRQLAGPVDDGAVRVSGKRARKGDRVAVGDVIELTREPVSGTALRPAPDPDVPLTVLAERSELVVVAKPAGIPSQPLRAGELGTVANA